MSRFFVTSRIVAAVLVSLVVSGSVLSQTAPVVGIRRTHPNVHVLDGARIVVAPGRVIERGRIVVRGARIAAVGADVVVPDGASVHDVSGLEVWPAFLEPWLGSDPAALKREPPPAEQHVHGHSVQDVPKADPHDHPSGGAHWNARIHPEHVALDDGMPNESRLAELRGAGFAIARLVPSSGILRGRASIITLANAPVANEPGAPVDLGTRIVRAEDVQCAAFERGSGRESYPNSLMGVIALCRQSFYDARWYREAMALHARDGRIARPVLDASLGALGDVAMGKSRIAFEVRSDEDALRVLKLKDEFDLDIELRGSGTEYRHARSFLGVPLIVPLRDIDAPAVSTEAEARAVSLRELLTHRHAPQNAARLAAIGVEFSLSSCLLDGPKDFREQLAKAIRAGLSENDALAATTIRPAALLGLADRTGTIEAGKAANFVVVDGSLLDPGAAIRTTWIEGIEHAVAPVDTDLEGRWQFEIGGFGTYVVEFSKEKPVARDEKESVPGPVLEATFEASLRQEQEGDDLRAIVAARRIASRIELSLRGDKLRDGVGVLRISGTVDGDRIDGHGHELGTELSFAWTAKRLEEDEKSRDDDETAPPSKLELERAIALPEGAYSRSMLPPQKSVLVRNATLWLNDEVVQGNDLLVMDGKIAAIGESLAAPDGALVIDGTSKHVTCGLIDAHSHTAIAGGVNESTLAVTSEVRIEDAIDPTDIGIYRELAGGLTVSH
ncbi:MAG: amidohydrolase family protein, partial [Planctomycetes bacterium]|nr:amidohydrolase family protein [Planctomycetota bacterium]